MGLGAVSMGLGAMRLGAMRLSSMGLSCHSISISRCTDCLGSWFKLTLFIVILKPLIHGLNKHDLCEVVLSVSGIEVLA